MIIKRAKIKEKRVLFETLKVGSIFSLYENDFDNLELFLKIENNVSEKNGIQPNNVFRLDDNRTDELSAIEEVVDQTLNFSLVHNKKTKKLIFNKENSFKIL